MDELVIDGKTFVSSKRASETSGYAQDYIGQLARGGHIDACRIGGLWYISMPSLEEYQNENESHKLDQPRYTHVKEPESLAFFDGKDYISASRASKLSGYNQDYIGQLARAGQILARQVGNRWYIERDSLMRHKQEKDALLAEVQSKSVGLVRLDVNNKKEVGSGEANIMHYQSDDKDLLPQPKKVEEDAVAQTITTSGLSGNLHSSFSQKTEVAIPIRLVKSDHYIAPLKPGMSVKPKLLRASSTQRLAMLSVAALTVVVVVTFGFGSFKSDSIYSQTSVHSPAMTGSVASVANRLLDVCENILSPALLYMRK